MLQGPASLTTSFHSFRAGCRLSGPLCLLLRCCYCRKAIGVLAIDDSRTRFLRPTDGRGNGCHSAIVAVGLQLSPLQLLVPIGAQDARMCATTPGQSAQDAAEQDDGPAECGDPRATGDKTFLDYDIRSRSLVTTYGHRPPRCGAGSCSSRTGLLRRARSWQGTG